MGAALAPEVDPPTVEVPAEGTDADPVVDRGQNRPGVGGMVREKVFVPAAMTTAGVRIGGGLESRIGIEVATTIGIETGIGGDLIRIAPIREVDAVMDTAQMDTAQRGIERNAGRQAKVAALIGTRLDPDETAMARPGQGCPPSIAVVHRTNVVPLVQGQGLIPPGHPRHRRRHHPQMI